MRANLWYCSLKNKVCHICLCWVGSVDCDDCDVWIRISSLKCEVYFQTILVVCRHRRNTYSRPLKDLRHVVTYIWLDMAAHGYGDQQTLTCSCNVIKQGLWGEAIQEERGLGCGHRGSRSRGWTTWVGKIHTPGFKTIWTHHYKR